MYKTILTTKQNIAVVISMVSGRWKG